MIFPALTSTAHSLCLVLCVCRDLRTLNSLLPGASASRVGSRARATRYRELLSEREREREGGRGREGEGEREDNKGENEAGTLCVCVCVCTLMLSGP